MATGVELSRRQPVAPLSDADTARRIDSGSGGSGGSGKVTRASLYRNMRGVWPAADVTNGPLTVDSGITSTSPSTSGMRFVQWDSGKFNTQSQNLVAVPSSNGPASGAACQNTTTDRGNFGSSGIGTPCHTDVSFVTDSAKIIPVYWQNPTGSAGVNTSYHEVQIFAEIEGQMKGIRRMPAAWPGGAASNQTFWRPVSFLEAKSREITVMLSANCWLMGVWIDSTANIMKAPNRPLLDAFHGNSWGEPNGNVFSFFGGNGAVVGVGFNQASLLYSCVPIQNRLTSGAAAILCNQGGTQWVNANGSGISRDDATTKGFTSTWSQNQVNFLWSTFGSRYPTAIAIGNYNDGDNPVAGTGTTLRNNYRDVVLYAIDKLVTRFTTGGPALAKIPIILGGGEPKLAVAGANRDLTNLGILDAGALRPNNVIGTFNFFLDWPTSTTTADITPKLGPDGLHPLVGGAEAIGDNQAKRMGAFLMDSTWVNATLAA